MINEELFTEKLKTLPAIVYSKTRNASYTNFQLKGTKLHFIRVNTGEPWELDVKQLYQIYLDNKFINTSVVRQITRGRVNSPSVAVLMAIGCLDKIGNRIV